jgi:hypothetical protein
MITLVHRQSGPAVAVLLSLATAGIGLPVNAQTYPSNVIRIVRFWFAPFQFGKELPTT